MEQFKHFYIAENQLCHPGEEFLLHMDFPRCFIRYRLADGYFADFDEFFDHVADVQWIDGEKPDEATQRRILATAWSFLAIDEERLDRDLHTE